ncbi:MAG: hypothetical protein M1509_00600 [Nitrospirae bacterium]|nr:hypothetical protein [Nitrospirota bacterium]
MVIYLKGNPFFPQEIHGAEKNFLVGQEADMPLRDRDNGRGNTFCIEKGDAGSTHAKKGRVCSPFFLIGVDKPEHPLVPRERTIHIGNRKGNMVESGDPDHPEPQKRVI